VISITVHGQGGDHAARGFDPFAREVGIAVVHAQHRGDEAQDRVLLMVAFAIGQHDVPQAFDDASLRSS
jgi:hypothetical protein